MRTRPTSEKELDTRGGFLGETMLTLIPWLGNPIAVSLKTRGGDRTHNPPCSKRLLNPLSFAGAGQDAGASCPGLFSSAPTKAYIKSAFSARFGKPHFVHGSQQSTWCAVGVNLRGCRRFVAQQFLNDVQISSQVVDALRIGVPQDVGMQSLNQAGAPTKAADSPVNRLVSHGLARIVQNQKAGRPGANPLPNDWNQLIGDWYESLFVALAVFHQQLLSNQVDILDLDIAHFGQAQAGAKVELHEKQVASGGGNLGGARPIALDAFTAALQSVKRKPDEPAGAFLGQAFRQALLFLFGLAWFLRRCLRWKWRIVRRKDLERGRRSIARTIGSTCLAHAWGSKLPGMEAPTVRADPAPGGLSLILGPQAEICKGNRFSKPESQRRRGLKKMQYVSR